MPVYETMENPDLTRIADEYTSRLNRLYDLRKISVKNFKCVYAHSCCVEESRPLRRGAEAHVGERYGDPIRVVFVSLDTGGGGEKGEPLKKRRNVVQRVRLNRRPNPHMRGTIHTLSAIFDQSPEDPELLKRFAMTNSAKCSGSTRNAVANELYRNCRNHGLAELQALAPQLIVLQGTLARDMLGPLQHLNDAEILSFDLPATENEEVKRYLRRWHGDGLNAIVIKAPHPSAPKYWSRFRKNAMAPVCQVVREKLLPQLAVCAPLVRRDYACASSRNQWFNKITSQFVFAATSEKTCN